MGEEKDGEGERIIDGVLQNRTTRFAAVCIFTGNLGGLPYLAKSDLREIIKLKKDKNNI